MLQNNSLDQNPEKQSFPNIANFLDSSKLYKQANQNLKPLPKSRKNKDTKQIFSAMFNPLSDIKQRISRHLKTDKEASLSEKCNAIETNLARSSKVQRQSLRDNERDKADFKLITAEIGNSKARVSIPRNRFYYKQEYDQNDSDKDLSLEINNSKQHQMTHYLNRINRSRIQNPLRLGIPQKRSKSPLQQSHQQLFTKCYKETFSHLRVMLNSIQQSKQNIQLMRKQVIDRIYQIIKQKAVALREQMIDLTEELVTQWEKNEWQFAKNSQILFLDDILELEEQLNERQAKIYSLFQSLQKQRVSALNEPAIQGSKHSFRMSILNAQRVWKNVTTDLLMFNYENNILEISQLLQKISVSSSQKLKKALSILPSSGIFNKAIHYSVLDPQSKNWLKDTICNYLRKTIYPEKNQISYQMDSQFNRKSSNFTLSQFQFVENK